MLIGRSLKDLTALNLSTHSLKAGNNVLGKATAGAIANSLKNLLKLSLGTIHPYVEGNKDIGDEGAALIAKGLPQLKELDVESCSITNKGARAIANNLKSLTSLRLCKK